MVSVALNQIQEKGQAPVLPAVLQHYVSEVKKHLHGLVPDDRADLMLQECAYWVERHAKVLKDEGMEKGSLEEAIRAHGTSQATALNLIENYFELERNTPITKRVGRANLLALTVFGVGNMVYLMLLQLLVYLPASTTVLRVDPVAMRRYWPDPLPFPEASWQFGLTVGYPIVAPFILGWWVGKLIPVRAASTVFWAVMPLIIAAFFVGTALLPNKIGLLYAIVLTLFWLPVGSAMAHLSSSRLRRKRQGHVP